MDFAKNISGMLAHSQVFFSREAWQPVQDAVNQGYNVPISVATSTAQEVDPLTSADTEFIFGNDNTPSETTTSEPSQSSSATVAASEQGSATAGSSTGSGAGSATGTSSSTDLTWIIIGSVAAVILVLIAIFHKKL